MMSCKDYEDPMNLIMYMLQNDDNVETSTKLIELLSAKAHEKYYLHHKFDQKAVVNVSRYEHQVAEPHHYFYQNRSWILNDRN